MPNAMEVELQKATSVKPKKNEDRQAYLDRLVDTASNLEDDDFAKLAKDTQSWVNGVVKKYVNKGKPIPDFGDAEGSEVAAVEAAATPGKAKKAAKVDGAAKTAKKAAAADDEGGVSKSSGKVRAQRPLGDSAQTKIKRLLIKDPTLTPGDIAEKLVAAGITCSSVSIATIRSDFRHTLRVIQDEGKDVRGLTL